MGKKKSKKQLKIDKIKLKDILERSKNLKEQNDKKRDKIKSQSDFKNLSRRKQQIKKIKKNKSDNEINTQHTSQIQNLQSNQNLFQVQSFTQNINIDLQKQKSDDLLNIDYELKFVEDNPFKNSNKFLEENEQNNKEHYPVQQGHDYELKKLEIPYNEQLKQINELSQKFYRQNEIYQKSKNQKFLEYRNQLPIAQRESDIIESCYQNFITIICGETGSGKSTQVPQYLYENGYTKLGKIGITQPRRIAAIALAQRVSEEQGITCGQEIGYQVRFEKQIQEKKNKIKFMTDGILLNEMMSDLLLKDYSVIIIDEAHERKVATDILIGLLCKVIKYRAEKSLEEYKDKQNFEQINIHPLRLIIMSATLKIEDFLNNENLFKDKPPLIQIKVRTFPVSVFYNKITPDDYKENMIRKVKKIHLNLPQGGILVFLTGKDEVNEFCKLLNDEMKYIKTIKAPQEDKIINGEIDLENIDILGDNNDNDSFLTEEFEYLEESVYTQNDQMNYIYETETYQIYPLYSKLPSDIQQKIFNPDKNKRQIIVATNIAETSLTINGLKYLIDCGKEKIKNVNFKTGVTKYQVDWITQASAEQRKGRVGRTSMGYCYRIYSPAIYKNMKQFQEPEILKVPLNYTMLQLSKIGIKNLLDFKFPTQPEKKNQIESINELKQFDLLKQITPNQYQITELGEVLSYIPIDPKLSVFLLNMKNQNLLYYGVLMAGILNSEDLFQFDKEINSKEQKIEMRQKIDKYLNTKSDLFTFCNIIGEFFKNKKSKFFHNFQYLKQKDTYNQIKKFAKQFNISEKVFIEFLSFIIQIVKVFQQILDQNKGESLIVDILNYRKLKKHEEQLVINYLISSFNKNVAKKVIHVIDENKVKVRFETLDYREADFFRTSFIKKTEEFYFYQSILQIDEKYYLKNITKITDYTILINLDKRRLKHNELLERFEYQQTQNIQYDHKKDIVLAYYKYFFGPYKWETPIFLSDSAMDKSNRNVLFLMALIKGYIFKNTRVLLQKFSFNIKNLNFDKIKTDEDLISLYCYFKENDVYNVKTFQKIKKTKKFQSKFLKLIRPNFQKEISINFNKFFNQ